MTASFKFTKQITEIGLTLMKPSIRKSRIEEVMPTADKIDCEKLTSLIEICKTTAGAYLENNDGKVSTSEAENIRQMLGLVDAREAVNMADPEELTEWVKGLVKVYTRICTVLRLDEELSIV